MTEILDYFFGNFWHYLALLILLIAVGHKGNYIVQENKEQNDNNSSLGTN